MEKRVIAVTAICLLLLLVACESKTTGKRVAIPETSAPKTTGVFTTNTKQAPESTVETGKSAAETLKELKATSSIETTSSQKSGTFYPPIVTDAAEKEALKAKTRALMSKGTPVSGSTNTKGQFGAKYHDSDGDPINLPEKYSDNEGD
ncbi:MAG: hypothetical protein QW165_04335 [Candidatus Woesearchaeota archaeon]